jgi:MFS family permease
MGLLPRLPRPAWIVLGGDLVSALGTGLTLPFFIVYLHRIRGIDLTVASLALATIALASFAGNVIGGSLADRFGARRALMLGLVCSAGGTAWLAFVTTAPAAFGAAATLGLGNSIAWPSLDSLLATAVDQEQRSSVFAVRHATLNLGLGVGALLAATVVVVASTRSFQELYLLDGASFALCIPLLVLVPGVGRAPEHAEGGYRDVFRDRGFLAVWVLGVMFVAFGYSPYSAALPAYATSTGGLSPHSLGYVFAANMLGVAGLQLVVLRVAGGLRRTTMLACAAVAFAAAWAIAIAGGHGGGVAAFAAAMFVLALGETLISPALAPIVNDLAPDHLRGRYNGTFVLAYTVGFAVGPVLAGGGLRIGDGTPYFVFLVAGCVVACAWALRLGRVATPAVPEPA